MSTDYFLFSPSHRKSAMVGSIGLGGVKVWPTEYNGEEFLRWAIGNSVRDVVLVNEHDPRLEESDDDEIALTPEADSPMTDHNPHLCRASAI